MKRFTTFLKENYKDYLNFKISEKKYLKKGLWLYEIKSTFLNENEELEREYKYFLVSEQKNLNDLMNRKRGFNLNYSENNKVKLHDYYIEGYITIDRYNNNFKSW